MQLSTALAPRLWIWLVVLMSSATVDSHSGISAAERCLQDSLASIAAGCSGGTGTPPRDSLTSLLRRCLVDPSAPNRTNVPAKLLVVDGAYAPLLQMSASVYQNLSGVPVQVVSVPFQRATSTRLQSMANAANLSATHQAWMITPTAVGDGLAQGIFMDVTDLCLLDRRLQWEGVIPVMRQQALTYNSRVVGLPLSTWANLMYYREDVFQRHNIPVPRTWEDLLDVSTRFNGTEGLWGFCGGWAPCTQFPTAILRLVLASFHQTLGLGHGWLIDPDSMQPLFNSPATLRTFDIIRALISLSPPEPTTPGCFPGAVSFRQGKCMIAIDSAITFKTISHTSRAASMAGVQGNLGMAMLPGSDYVLDRPTNTLVPCDEQRCPYATRYTNASGHTRLVNHAPTFDSNVLPVNALSPPELAYYTFSVLAYVTSPTVSDIMVFHPDAEIYPCRTSQYQAERWVAAGFDPQDSKRFVAAAYSALQHPNINVNARMAGATQFTALLSEVGTNLTVTNQTTTRVWETMQAKATAIGVSVLANIYKGNSTARMMDYWASLNRPQPSTPPPAAHFSPGFPTPISTHQAGAPSGALAMTVSLSVVIPLLLLAIIIAALVYWRRVRLGLGSQATKQHPGAGPMTTLVITDIQDSTNLWEELESVVMDMCLKLHNACLRTCAADHGGYESAWEGDSFILAFHSPDQALQFAVDAQLKLLQQPWPATLLSALAGQPVWLAPVRMRSTKAASDKLIHDSSMGLATARSDSNASLGSLVDKSMKGGMYSRSGSFGGDIETVSASGDSVTTCDDGQLSMTIPTHTSDSEPQPSLPRPALPNNTYAEVVHAAWAPCTGGSVPGAVLAFRGLRVRIGMHCGVGSDSEITYNPTMQRYNYSGTARVTAAAVASAAHGGQILLSGAALAALLASSPSLPVCVGGIPWMYHMGHHELEGVPGWTELSMVLPKPLKCRVAVLQKALRSLHCSLAGVLDMPVASHAAAPVLVHLQLSGMEALLAWNAGTARTALANVYSCVLQQISELKGIITEDYLPMTAISQGKGHPGALVVVLHTAASALEFCLVVRQQLLCMDWDPELLQHHLCEPVGMAHDTPATSTAPPQSTVIRNSCNPGPPPTLTLSTGPSQSALLSLAKLRAQLNPLPGSSPQNVPQQGSPGQLPSLQVSKGRKVKPGDQVLDAPYLRGIRARFLLVACSGKLKLLCHSTGRAVYSMRFGRTKQAVELLKAIRPGQIKIQGDVVEQLMHS